MYQAIHWSLWKGSLFWQKCTIKPELTTTSELKPPVINDHYFEVPFSINREQGTLNSDHLSTTTTIFGSQGWSLYTGLTVYQTCHISTYLHYHQTAKLSMLPNITNVTFYFNKIIFTREKKKTFFSKFSHAFLIHGLRQHHRFN